MQLKRWRGVVVSAVILAIATLGCSSDDNPTKPLPPQSLSLSGAIGPEGGVLSSDDGLMTLTVPPGALADTTVVSVTEIDVADVEGDFADFQAFRAFAISPAGIDLGADSEWSISFDAPLPKKVLGDRVRKSMPIATTTLHPEGGNLQIRVPEQDLSMTLPSLGVADPDMPVPPDRIVLRGFGGDEAVLTYLPESGGGSSFVWAGGDQEMPATVTQGENFDLSMRISLSHDMTFPSELDYLEGDQTAGVTSQATLGMPLQPILTGEYADQGSWSDLQLTYHADSAGTGYVHAGVSFQSSLAATYWDSHPAVVQPVGSRRTALLFPWLRSIIQEGTSSGDPVQTGKWPVGLSAMEGFGRPLKVAWPLQDAVVGAGAEGVGFFSLHSVPPFQTANSALAQGSNPMYGALMVLITSLAQKQAPGDDRVLVVSYGLNGGGLTQWDPAENAFTWTQLYELSSNVTDACAVDGDPMLGAFCYVDNSLGRVWIYTWNPSTQAPDPEGPYASWEGTVYFPVSAYVRQSGSMVAVTDGTPGLLHLHDRVDPNAAAAMVGIVGDSPRRVRVLGDIGVVSNYGSGSLTTFTWDNADNIAVADTITVGDGPIGIDLVSLPGNQVGIVSTGYGDDSWSVTVVDAAGRMVSNTKHDLPAGASAPGHAIFLDETGSQVLVSCNGTNNVVVADSGL